MKKTNKLVTKTVGSFEGSEAAEYDVVEVTTTQDPAIRRYHEEEIDSLIEQEQIVISSHQEKLDELNEYKKLFK